MRFFSRHRQPQFPATAFLLLAGFCSTAPAAEVVVQVGGIRSDAGEIGCALFSTAKGFPLDTGAAKLEWLRAQRNGVECRFTGLHAGTFAVAVSHDLNGNRRTDTKLFGIPTEDWGVSNNVRHRMRAPNFQEAAFPVTEGKTVRIQIEVGR
jgi:uncharacterized protein (DUF2141 family)